MKRKKRKLTEEDLRDRAEAIERGKRFKAYLDRVQAELDAKKTATGRN